jgi:preprotein translocase subunit SecD
LATTRVRPGRNLIVLALIAVLLLAAMIASKAWTPKLGLDLRGGSQITLSAQGEVTRDKMTQAVNIILARVAGSGVTEPEITTQGSNNIVVSVPGVDADQIVKLVGQTAELRFRQVLAVDAAPPQPTPTATPKATPKPKATPTPKATAKSSGDRNPAAFLSAPKATATPTPEPGPAADAAASSVTIQTQPPADAAQKLAAFTCAKQGQQRDVSKTSLLACDREGQLKYMLGPAIIEGVDIADATAGIEQGQTQFSVQLRFKGSGTDKFGKATNQLYTLTQPLSQFAIVLDGKVISAPVVNGPIPGGSASITGSFTQASAKDLADVLRYGALPLKLDVVSVDAVSPLLGADQLRGGLLAGLLGLALVVVYCFFYYRGLGLVVVTSLAVAGSLTYASVVLLGHAQGLTLTLAGIAGLIVSIGITADSFIVYFERIRDEIRDGRGLRSAVESGWTRARRTILAADSISLLAAVVLYALSVGNVRGFAYMLGLSTVIDIVVVFLFTKPVVTLLAKTHFFGGGHPLSGLSPARLGVRSGMLAGARPGRRRGTPVADRSSAVEEG